MTSKNRTYGTKTPLSPLSFPEDDNALVIIYLYILKKRLEWIYICVSYLPTYQNDFILPDGKHCQNPREVFIILITNADQHGDPHYGGILDSASSFPSGGVIALYKKKRAWDAWGRYSVSKRFVVNHQRYKLLTWVTMSSTWLDVISW